MRDSLRDAVSGGVLLSLGTALALAIPHQVETLESDTLTPAFVPALMAGVVIVLSAILLVRGVYLARRDPGSGAERHPLAMAYMTGVALVAMAYVALIPVLGFLLATGLALGGFSWLYGHRNRWQVLVLMLVTPPAVFFFFRYTMLVLLPPGSLFN